MSSETDKTGDLKTHRDGDVVLRDGSTVRIRVMKQADEAGLRALLQSLSEDSRWLRFYSLSSNSALAAEAHREATLDHTLALVACSGAEQRIVGHAFYVGSDEQDAAGMIHELKTYPLLTGFRGAPVCDVAALQDGLLRLSAMVEDLPQIAELDLNP